jgi:hypothetical protein
VSINPFIIGATVKVTASIVDPATNLPADPGGLLLKVRSPDKTLLTYSYGADPDIVKDSTGNYHADLLLDKAGVWHWRWEAGGAHTGVAEGTLTAKASLVL